MDYQQIIYDIDEGILTITLNRPDKLNAFTGQMMTEMINALDRADADDTVKAIIVTGAGRGFCAGADLTQILEGSLSGDRFQSVTNQIAALPIPTIAVLTGHVFGGGAELAMSCDFRLAREEMILRIPAAAIGLCYPVEGIERLTRRLGPSLARRMLVAAETFTAEQMLSLRLVDAVHPAAALREAALRYATSLLALAPMAVTSMLDIIRQLEAGALDRDHAGELARACSDSKDVQEGITAQREKRAPVFKNQ